MLTRSQQASLPRAQSFHLFPLPWPATGESPFTNSEMVSRPVSCARMWRTVLYPDAILWK
jgi:hypothetical protein